MHSLDTHPDANETAATHRDAVIGHPYALLGASVVACVLLALAVAGLGYGGIRFRAAGSLLSGLLLCDAVLATALVYTLLTLHEELQAERETGRRYAQVGMAVMGLVSAVAIASFAGLTELRVSADRLAAWLAVTGLLIAAGLAYLLFSLRVSLDPDNPTVPPYAAVAHFLLMFILGAVVLLTLLGARIGALGSPTALAALTLVRFSCALALTYTLLVLGDSLAERRFQRRERHQTTPGPPLAVAHASSAGADEAETGV